VVSEITIVNISIIIIIKTPIATITTPITTPVAAGFKQKLSKAIEMAKFVILTLVKNIAPEHYKGFKLVELVF
jgi:hypothetical protein